MVKKVRRTKGGSPIVYETSLVNVSGTPGYSRSHITGRRAYVEDKDGFSHRVPIDSKGKVPLFAIIQHFLNTKLSEEKGSPRNIAIDLTKPAKTVHRIPDGGFTPEQIVATGWWDDPSSCDIEGIDDSTSPFMYEWDNVGKGARSKTRRIAVIGTPSERDVITRTLTRNFTDQELTAAVKDGGMVIIQGPTGHSNWIGMYTRRQASNETPDIVLKSLDEDTITHEMVHHMRDVDPLRKGFSKTPILIDVTGHYQDRKDLSYDSVTNLEEAATVAEATLRTEGLSENSGYYGYLRDAAEGRTGKDSYDHDRRLLTDADTGKGGPLRGKRARDRVEDRFLDTDISLLQISGKGMRADKVARKLAGIPEPEKPKEGPGVWKRVGVGHWQTTDLEGKPFDLYKPGTHNADKYAWLLAFEGGSRIFYDRRYAEDWVRDILRAQRRDRP